MSDKIEMTRCAAPQRATELADFFVRNVGPDYISHSELQGGRALSPTEWRPNLRDVLQAELATRLALTGKPAPDCEPIALAELGGAPVALAFVTFAASAPAAYGVVEDLIVAPSTRGKGIGKAMLD
jgi:ribosomal protein S18 acetylase RimI-like enzyme